MGWDDRQEVEGRWESETSVEGDGEAVYCGKCFTETALTCKLARSKTLVSIQVYKDVGQGLHPADPKWQALVGAWKVKRDPADFLWTRRETEAIHEQGRERRDEAEDTNCQGKHTKQVKSGETSTQCCLTPLLAGHRETN